MKIIYRLLIAGFVFGVLSCSDESTDKEEAVTTTPATVSPAPSPEPKSMVPAEPKKEKVVVTVRDTPKTEISIGQNGGSVKTKKGTSVRVNDKGINVGSKDVIIDLKKDSN